VRESKTSGAISSEIPHPLLDILSREYTSPILVHLLRNPHSTASETAAALGIHIATAQKYLVSLEIVGLVRSRERPSKPRTAKEYILIDTRISFEIDIERIAEEVEAGVGGGGVDLAGIMIREKARSDVAYEWDDEGQRITTVMFFRKGLRRRMERKVVLPVEEGRFLWHVPFQSESFRSVEKVMGNAGLKMNAFKVMEMIGKFEGMDIVIVARGSGG